MTVHFATALPAGLDASLDVDGAAEINRIGVRRARAGDLVDAYPSGTHDRELLVEGSPSAAELARVTGEILAGDARCRRVVLAVPEQDLGAIAWAEDAGYRYVVDVETRSGEWSLLVTEPDWVLEQPVILEDIPLT